MQSTVDAIKVHVKKSFAAVIPLKEDETPMPIAIVMGSLSNPVMYMPSNASNMIKEEDGSDTSGSVSPTAAVTSMTETLRAPKAL